MLHNQKCICKFLYYLHMYADLAYISYKAVWQSGGLWESCRVTARFQGSCAICLAHRCIPSLPFSLPTPFLCFSLSLSEDLRMTWRISGIQKTFGFQLLLAWKYFFFCLRVSCDVSFLFRDPNGLRISGIFFLCFLPSSFFLHFLFVCKTRLMSGSLPG